MALWKFSEDTSLLNCWGDSNILWWNIPDLRDHMDACKNISPIINTVMVNARIDSSMLPIYLLKVS